MRQAPTTQYLLQYYAAQMQPCYRSSCRPHVLSTSKVSPCKPSHMILDGTHGVRTRCFIRCRKQKNSVSAILYVAEGRCRYIRDAKRKKYGATAHDRNCADPYTFAHKRTIQAIGLQPNMSATTELTNKWDWVIYSKRDPRDLQALQVYRLEISHIRQADKTIFPEVPRRSGLEPRYFALRLPFIHQEECAILQRS
jgi:hypothetical protein